MASGKHRSLNLSRTLPAAALLLAGCAAAAGTAPRTSQPGEHARASIAADLVLTNGRIVTVDSARPEAQALAIVGERIAALGSNADIQRHVGPGTQVIDLQGRLAVPGFIEGHGHFMGLGRARMILDLAEAPSWDEIVQRVAEAARDAAPGEWITGRGWHQDKWETPPQPAVEGNPVHHGLSGVSPENPVYLTHASGHASFVNARAMELAGITPATRDPAGGEIVKDAEGNPTGLLRETAQGLVGAVLAAHEARRSPAEIEAEARRMVQLAGEEALAKGVTSFHDAGSPFATIDFLRRLAEEGELPVRLYVMVRGESNEVMNRRLPEYRMIGYANNFLTVRSIKRQIDGALGAHGAWLLAPYLDLPGSEGLVLETPQEVAGTAAIALRHGYQLNTHAIGDRANRVTLDLYETAFWQAGVRGRELRWRIEHAQHVDPIDVPRFAQLGVIASMQAVHATSDGPWVPQRLGAERAGRTSYLWRDLLDSGALVTNGTDAPVEDINPIDSFYASVTRHMANSARFFPEQRMSRDEALRSYTINNAYAAFEEELKGSLTPGKLADIVVLSRDIMTVPDEEIRGAEAVYTIIGGEVRYRHPTLAQ
jgi:predicted amidohydrolase YtcJ